MLSFNISYWDLIKFHYLADTTENWLITVNTAYLSLVVFFFFFCWLSYIFIFFVVVLVFSSFSLPHHPPPPPGAPGLSSSSSSLGWLGCAWDSVSSSSPEQSPRRKKIWRLPCWRKNWDINAEFFRIRWSLSEYFPSLSLLVLEFVFGCSCSKVDASFSFLMMFMMRSHSLTL